MIEYTFPASGSSPGVDLWRYTGGVAPDTIDINTPVGVTGLAALLPTNTNLKLLLTSALFPGVEFSGEVFSDGVNLYANGVLVNGGVESIISSYVNSATGAENTRNQDSISTNKQITDGNDVLQITELKNQFSVFNIDLVLNNTSDLNISPSIIELQNQNSASDRGRILVGSLATSIGVESIVGTGGETIYGTNAIVNTFRTGGVTDVQTVLGSNGFSVVDGATVIQFKISPSGQILTGQAQAPAIHAMKQFDLPIYDTTGILLGYIPIML